MNSFYLNFLFVYIYNTNKYDRKRQRLSFTKKVSYISLAIYTFFKLFCVLVYISKNKSTFITKNKYMEKVKKKTL